MQWFEQDIWTLVRTVPDLRCNLWGDPWQREDFSMANLGPFWTALLETVILKAGPVMGEGCSSLM